MIFKRLIAAAGVVTTLGAAAPAFADIYRPVVVAPVVAPAPVAVAYGYGRGGYGYGYGGYRRYEGRRVWHPVYRPIYRRGWRPW